MCTPRALLAASFALCFVETAGSQSLTASSNLFLALDDVEITPNEHYAIVRQNRVDAYALVFDLTTGTLVSSPVTGGSLCGDVVDAVAVTDDRAIVLGGSQCVILDLTQVGTPNILLASQEVGTRPNDVAITPDGSIAAVRGGSPNAFTNQGQFLFDLQSGQMIGSRAGLPPLYPYSGPGVYSYDTDSVALTDAHVVMLSIIGQTSSTPMTRVTIWDLHPSAGAPSVVFETTVLNDLFGAPHDVAISPDGTHAAVRSEFRVAAFQLSGASSSLLWSQSPFQSSDAFQDEALDSIEATDTRIVTISRHVTPPSTESTQVDVFEWNGAQYFDIRPGSPHDLALTPDGSRAVVRTKAGVFEYPLYWLPPTPQLIPGASVAAPSSTVGFQDALDSIAVNDRLAVTLTHTADLLSTDVWFWFVLRPQLRLLAHRTIVGSRPIDVTITADGSKAIVTGTSSISVFHLATGGLVFEHRPIGPNHYYQWCDGVAASENKTVGIGQWAPQAGWIDMVDMTPFAASYCTGAPNSTGHSAAIAALGKASVSANSLKLTVSGVPPFANGRFVYGATQTNLPFGDGVQCVGLPSFGLRFQDANQAGAAFYPVNFGALSSAGAISPGATWHFQFIYSDLNSTGSGVNSSDALSITFVP